MEPMFVYGEKTKHRKEMKQAPGGGKKITTKPDPEISNGEGESLNKDVGFSRELHTSAKNVKPQRRSCSAGYGWGTLNFASLQYNILILLPLVN